MARALIKLKKPVYSLDLDIDENSLEVNGYVRKGNTKMNDDVKLDNSKNDPVNHPSHYTAGGIECIDAIAAALTSQDDPMSAWLTGQCLKYLWRWPLKNGLEDLKKTRFYLDRLIKYEEEK